VRIIRIHDGAEVRLQVRGELDLASVELVEEQVARALESGPERLVVDLARLTFCDSSGIDVLLKAGAEAESRGVTFRVARPRGIVRRSMEVLGVLESLTRGQTVKRPAASRSRSAST
jgi:anti-sigma B factor antagonist